MNDLTLLATSELIQWGLIFLIILRLVWPKKTPSKQEANK